MRRYKQSLKDLHSHRSHVSAIAKCALSIDEAHAVEDTRSQLLSRLVEDGLLPIDCVAAIDIEPLIRGLDEMVLGLPTAEIASAFEQRYWDLSPGNSRHPGDVRAVKGWKQDVEAALVQMILSRAVAEWTRLRDIEEVSPKTAADPGFEKYLKGFAFTRPTRQSGQSVRPSPAQQAISVAAVPRLSKPPPILPVALTTDGLADASQSRLAPQSRQAALARPPARASSIGGDEEVAASQSKDGVQPPSPALEAALKIAMAEVDDETAATTDAAAPPMMPSVAVIPAQWRSWIEGLNRVTHVALRTFDGLWAGLSKTDRVVLLNNVKARLERSKGRKEPVPIHAIPVHLFAPKPSRPGGPIEEIWIDLTTAKPGRQPIDRRMRAGVREEVICIDRMLASVAHAMVRLGLSAIVHPADPEAARSVMTADEYAAWLEPEPWQHEDQTEARALSSRSQLQRQGGPHVCIDLLASPVDIVAATPWPESKHSKALLHDAGTIDHPNGVFHTPREADVMSGLPRLHLSLVERKAQLLFLLRGMNVRGLAHDDPELWVGEPWVDEFATHGLFEKRREGEPWTRAAPGTADPALVEDLVCGILAPMGLSLVARLERASDAMARIRTVIIEPIRAKSVLSPPAITYVDGTATDDPPTRVMIAGGSPRSADAVLTRADREHLFARSIPMEGSASDPGFILPVGCVLVIPDGEPAYIRGRGYMTKGDGTLICGPKPDTRLMPFHLEDRHRDAAMAQSPPSPCMAPGPSSVYYRGYRWSLRLGGGNRRWDQTETEQWDRATRMWDRYVDMVCRGEDPDGRIGSRTPLHYNGYEDFRPFPAGSSNGFSAVRFRIVFSSANGIFDPDDFLCLPFAEARWPEGGGPITRRARPWAPRTVIHPASWERSWENAAVHDRRWGAASLPPELFDTTAFRLLDGRRPIPGDTVPLAERITKGRIAADAEVRDLLSRDAAFQLSPANIAVMEAARERYAFMLLAAQAEDLANKKHAQAAKTREHRKRGRERGERLRVSERASHAGTRLAYIPDPAIDGSDAMIEIVAYDPNYRPEMAVPSPNEMCEVSPVPLWDFEKCTEVDPAPDNQHIYEYRAVRESMWAYHGRFVMGEIPGDR